MTYMDENEHVLSSDELDTMQALADRLGVLLYMAVDWDTQTAMVWLGNL